MFDYFYLSTTSYLPLFLIQLDVKGCSDIYESLRKYTGKEMLDGENQYDAGPALGKQDAEKGVIFSKFPPVLTVHLKRFDFDLQRMVGSC
jgi:ubiquitin carboxyl-terminal hydrolase 7